MKLSTPKAKLPHPKLYRRIESRISRVNLRTGLSLTLLASLLGTSIAEASLKIYYIRHAQAGHNVRADWEDSGIPENEWPSYVGDAETFTPLGLQQLAAVPGKLHGINFDFIASSSIFRARNTILPYMQEQNITGEVWPELAEAYNGTRILDDDLPTINDPVLEEGGLIDLPSNETSWFSLRPDGLYDFDIPDFSHYEDEDEEKRHRAAAARIVQDELIDRIQDDFGGTNQTILLAGHGSSGLGLLRILTNNIWDENPDLDSINNTGIWMVEEQPNGEFELKIFNDSPIQSYYEDPEDLTVEFEDLRANLSDGEIDGLSASNSDVTITKRQDGLDYIYSLSIKDQDFDGVGDDNDSLSWDIRVKAFDVGSHTLDGDDSSVSLGNNLTVAVGTNDFGILGTSGDRRVNEGQSIQFSVENIVLTADLGIDVKFDGFNEFWGTDGSYIFGVGNSGLESLVTGSNGSKDDFTQTTVLTITAAEDEDLRIRDLGGSFTVGLQAIDKMVAHWKLDDHDDLDDLDDSFEGLAIDSTQNEFHGEVTGGADGWEEGQNGGALNFDGQNTSIELPSDAFDTLDDEVTFALWAYGANTQARADTVLYANDSDGNRVLNIHLPWSNSKVYWDAGDQSDSYDRISKTVSSSVYKGSWNHWIFTKDAAEGVMKIYLNGSLFHSGTGKTKNMQGIRDVTLGSTLSGLNYEGLLDDVRLYDIALTDDEASELYIRAITAWIVD